MMLLCVLFLFSLLSSVKCTPGTQIDAVVLDELLREIVDTSMSDLRHRLQEAVFATAFRRRIQQHATSSIPATPSRDAADSKEISAIDKLLDDYIKPQKLSLALETFTTTSSTTPRPVQLVTADDVTFQKGSGEVMSTPGRMFDDAFKETPSARTFSSMPRVPVWVAVAVCTACVLTFILLIGTLVYFISSARSKRNESFGMNERRIMPDPLTVQGLCHTTSPCHIQPIQYSHSRRNSFVFDQDRAASSIWAQP